MQHAKPSAPPPQNTPSTPVVYVLFLLCLGVFALQTLSSPAFEEGLVQAYALIPARVSGLWPAWHIGSPIERYATLVTALFMHSGVMHFVSNMVFLYFLGRRVEVVLGPVHTASLYVISGISGGLLQVWMDPGGSIPVLGASGAISGFFGAYALFFSRSKVADKRLFGLLIPGYLLRIIWIIAFWIILQFLIGFFLNDAQTGGIAIGAHIGGFLAGIAYALVWLAWLRLASRHV